MSVMGVDCFERQRFCNVVGGVFCGYEYVDKVRGLVKNGKNGTDRTDGGCVGWANV